MADHHERQELRPHLRGEAVPDDSIIVVRGGPTSIEKLAAHAARTHAAYVLDGRPLFGVSVFCALDDIGPSSLDGLLQRFAPYRVVHLPLAGQLREAGFELLASFRRPHFTVRLGTLDQLPQLLEALGKPESNPYHGRRTGRR
jgi:hypothetical protein